MQTFKSLATGQWFSRQNYLHKDVTVLEMAKSLPMDRQCNDVSRIHG